MKSLKLSECRGKKVSMNNTVFELTSVFSNHHFTSIELKSESLVFDQTDIISIGAKNFIDPKKLNERLYNKTAKLIENEEHDLVRVGE